MKIGIIGAMEQELEPIRNLVQPLERIEKGLRVFWHGESNRHEIYLTRCDPGKVNAAIAHTCEVNGVPLLCNRAISDKADHSAKVSFRDFLTEATANYGKIFELAFEKIGDAI